MTPWFLAVSMCCAQASAAGGASGHVSTRPILGAIRWDAWQDDGGVRQWVEKSLSPARFHDRAPWFAKVLGENRLVIPTPGQAVMDQEIAYARRAGIDYWAFCTYPERNGMSRGLRQYLASRDRNQVKFCLNLQGGWLRAGREWRDEVDRYVRYFRMPNYQTVCNGRPLVFLHAPQAGIKKLGREACREAFDMLSRASVAAGCARPYLAAQTANRADMDAIGFDALSAYATASISGRGGRPYAEASAWAMLEWEARKDTGAHVVPLATAGWDERPRSLNTPPWVKPKPAPRHCEPPTPGELADHLRTAMDWVCANPEACPARAVLVYAWNENDEGGWLVPTLRADGGANTGRADAVGAMVRAYRPRPLALEAAQIPRDGLILWLDASDANTVVRRTAVTRWKDKSGRANDALASKPGVRRLTIDGRSLLRLSEGDGLAVPSIRASDGCTVFVVSQRPADAQGRPNGRLVSVLNRGSEVDWRRPGWLVYVRAPAPYRPRVQVKSVGRIDNGLRIGADMANGQSLFVGDLFEILVYARKLSGREVLSVRTALGRKWRVGR